MSTAVGGNVTDRGEISPTVGGNVRNSGGNVCNSREIEYGLGDLREIHNSAYITS